MVGINPLGFMIPLALIALGLIILPALVLPWKLSCLYLFIIPFFLTFAWYRLDIESGLLFTGIFLIAVAFLIALIWRGIFERDLKPSASKVGWGVFLGVFLLVLICELIKSQIFVRGLTPQELRPLIPVYIPQKLWSQCDMIVWRIQPVKVLTIKLDNWIASPYSEVQDGNWLNGISCSSAPESLKGDIVEAMNLPGSFYKSDDGRVGYIVILKLGYAVTVFNRPSEGLVK